MDGRQVPGVKRHKAIDTATGQTPKPAASEHPELQDTLEKGSRRNGRLLSSTRLVAPSQLSAAG
jgi:hypothetical protein